MQCNYNSFIQIINFHGLFQKALRCRKTGACRILVPLWYYWNETRPNWWTVGGNLHNKWLDEITHNKPLLAHRPIWLGHPPSGNGWTHLKVHDDLLLSVGKVVASLVIQPQIKKEMVKLKHYFKVCNYLWKTKTGFEELFYRSALYHLIPVHCNVID